MQATPQLFRPAESPPVAVHAPGSHAFPRVRIRLLTAGPLSTSRFPSLPYVSPIHLLSRRLRPVNPATSSGMDVTPDPLRPSQRPLVSSPGLLVCGWRASAPLFRVQVPPTFHNLRCFLSAAFTSRVPNLDQAYDTAFDRCEPVSSDRVLGVHATPVPYQAGSEPPGNQPRSQPVFPECARLSSRTTLASRRAAFTSRFSGPRGPFGDSVLRRQPHAEVCILPLLLKPSRAS